MRSHPSFGHDATKKSTRTKKEAKRRKAHPSTNRALRGHGSALGDSALAFRRSTAALVPAPRTRTQPESRFTQ
jgi:hypothetical protein